MFFVTRTDYSPSRYSPGLGHLPVLTLILPFFGTRWDSYSILARILPLPYSRPDSIIFCPHTDSAISRYSPRKFFHTRRYYTPSWYSPGFDHFSVLKVILIFFGTRSHSFSILARILPFAGTRPDSTFFRY